MWIGMKKEKKKSEEKVAVFALVLDLTTETEEVSHGQSLTYASDHTISLTQPTHRPPPLQPDPAMPAAGAAGAGLSPDGPSSSSPPASSSTSSPPQPQPGASKYAIRLFGPKDDHSICKIYVEKAKKGTYACLSTSLFIFFGQKGCRVSLETCILISPSPSLSLPPSLPPSPHTAPRVQELLGAITDLGCPIDLDTMVDCRKCNIAATGGFIANHQGLKEGEYKPKVVVCEDNLLGSHYVAQTLAHELVHAYDQCRAKVNWRSCYHYACTEIRASTLSGECDFIEEFDRGNFGMRAQHQECVRRRAELSMMVNESCKDRAKEVIEKVFARCYQDTAPYDKIP